MTTLTLVTMLVMLVVLAAACLLAPRGEDAGLLAIAALMVVAAFAAVRNTALAALAMAAPLAYHADLAAARLRSHASAPAIAQVAAARSARAPMPRAVQVVIALAALLLALRAGLISRTLRAASPSPVGAVGFMTAHGLGGNVLVEYGWGGYLIWHAPPGSKVFIDSRFEMIYPPRVQRDYLNFLSGGAEASAALAAYPTDYVLMPPDSAASRFMARQAGWRMEYRDPVAALFARADSPAAHLAGVPLLRDQAPPSVFP